MKTNRTNETTTKRSALGSVLTGVAGGVAGGAVVVGFVILLIRGWLGGVV